MTPPVGWAQGVITTASGGGGGNGATSQNPADSGRAAYEGGLRTSKAWITIPGNGAFEFDYDYGDRYGTGEYGWIKYDRWFFGANYSNISWTQYGSPNSIYPAWSTDNNTHSNNTISEGRFRIGKEESHNGGNSLSTIRYRLPAHTSVRWWMQAHTYGGDTADCGYMNENYYGIINNSPYENNGNGYWTVIWDGSPSGSWGSNMLSLDPGNWCSGNNWHSGSQYRSWGSERGTSYNSYCIHGTTDAYREYRIMNEWELWLH